MRLVPKQVIADEEVISYWLKKTRWGLGEFAALFYGINPYVYKDDDWNIAMGRNGQITKMKKQEIKDLSTLITDRLDTIEIISNTPIGWKNILQKLNLSQPAWMVSIEEAKPIETQGKAPVPEKPLGKIERDSLLTIIAALCDYSDIDLKARDVVAQIVGMTEEIGAPLSDDTVRRHLNKIPDALEDRMK